METHFEEQAHRQRLRRTVEIRSLARRVDKKKPGGASLSRGRRGDFHKEYNI